MDFPINALPARCRDAVEAQAALGNYPLASVGTAALAIMAHAAQGLANVIDVSQADTTYPCSELFMVLQKSGDAKSAVYTKLMTGIYRWHEAQEPIFEAEMADFEVAMEEWEREVKDAGKESDKANRVAWLRQLKDSKPLRPRSRDNILSKVTTNGLFKALHEDWPTQSLITDEGGAFLGGHSLKAENGPVEFAALITGLYNNGKADRKTGTESTKVSGRRLSGLIMVQPDVARSFLQNTVFQNQGIHARFCIAQPPSWAMPATKFFSDPDHRARQSALIDRTKAFADRIYSMLSQPLPMDAKAVLDLPSLEWEHPAIERGEAIFADFCAQRGQSDQGYTYRLFEHVCRLAGILALFEGVSAITLPIVEAAWALVQFFAHTWRNLELDVGSDRDSSHAIYVDKLLATLKRGGSLTTRDICRGPLRNLNADVRARVLKGMLEDGLVTAEEVASGVNKTTRYSAL